MIVAMTAETIRCAWCSQTFVQPPRGSGQPQVYCSRLHQDWVNAVAMGKYPLVDCPRCGRHELRIAAPDWAICQTCGYQTDRPHLSPGQIAPRDMFRGNAHIRARLAS